MSPESRIDQLLSGYKTVGVACRCTPQLREMIREIAAECEVSSGDLIRRAVAQFVVDYEAQRRQT